MNEFVDMPGCRICGAPSDRQSVRAEHVFGGRSDHRFFEC